MSQIQVNGASLKVSMREIKPESIDQAIANAKKNGADDVFLKIGDDVFQASGRGLPMDVLNNKKAVVTVGDRVAKVIATDSQLNSFGDGMAHPLGIGAGILTAGFSVYQMWKGNLGGLMSLLVGIPFIAFGVFNAIPAVYGAFRRVNSD
jgi:ABC-type phosphate transport system permease subunit